MISFFETCNLFGLGKRLLYNNAEFQPVVLLGLAKATAQIAVVSHVFGDFSAPHCARAALTSCLFRFAH